LFPFVFTLKDAPTRFLVARGGPKVKIQPDGESLTAERKGDPQLNVEGMKQ